ncbi:MAG: 3-dehydroquinate synthase [Bradyrhizobium sp.]|nr:3-dehydroquinate synthase [Bradyrhizobium sp.]
MPETISPASASVSQEAEITAALGTRSIVLVGMMGAGKSTVGRRLSVRLHLPFLDADSEIELAHAGMTIPEIFANHGEPYFRDGEARVIARLLDSGPGVIATGGGAVMREETRNRIGANAVSIWLKADADTIMKRVKRRADRPLLQTADPAGTVGRLIREREPLYQLADITIWSRDVPHERIVDECIDALHAWLCREGAQEIPDIKETPDTNGFTRMTAPLKHSDSVTLEVALGERTYDIVIGRDVLQSLGGRIAALRPGARTAIVTDRNVAKLWLEKTEASLAAAGIATSRIIVEEGEGSKTYRGLEQVSEALIAAKIERNDLVVALGGGVVGDLAGFVAAILRRGVDFVQVPTSLLAPVDSSVGGKTGINSPQGKNLLGAFHQPLLVIADTAVLDTLSPRQFRAGYAEVAKYGVLGDQTFFAWLEANHAGIFAGGAAREYAIATSCRAKAAIVARDERETGERALLNLGHTFGHALEAATGFSDRLFHGEGVAVGMVLAAEFSAQLGMMAEADAIRVKHHLAEVGLPTHLQDIAGFAQEGLADADALMALMAQDKKVRRGRLTFILLKAIGQAVIAPDVEPALVHDFLQRKLAQKA